MLLRASLWLVKHFRYVSTAVGTLAELRSEQLMSSRSCFSISSGVGSLFPGAFRPAIGSGPPRPGGGGGGGANEGGGGGAGAAIGGAAQEEGSWSRGGGRAPEDGGGGGGKKGGGRCIVVVTPAPRICSSTADTWAIYISVTKQTT